MTTCSCRAGSRPRCAGRASAPRTMRARASRTTPTCHSVVRRYSTACTRPRRLRRGSRSNAALSRGRVHPSRLRARGLATCSPPQVGAADPARSPRGARTATTRARAHWRGRPPTCMLTLAIPRRRPHLSPIAQRDRPHTARLLLVTERVEHAPIQLCTAAAQLRAAAARMVPPSQPDQLVLPPATPVHRPRRTQQAHAAHRVCVRSRRSGARALPAAERRGV